MTKLPNAQSTHSSTPRFWKAHVELIRDWSENWLFAGTPDGAAASALLYSLIETAKMNSLEPYAYLRYILNKLPTAISLEDYEAMLPWNITPQQLNLPGLLECG